MARAIRPDRPASSRPRPAAGGPEANKYIKKARRRPPAGKIRTCKHASRASKIRHAIRDPARGRRGGNTFPDRWRPRRAELLSPTGVYPPCRRNHPARAIHAKIPPPQRIHSFTFAKNIWLHRQPILKATHRAKEYGVMRCRIGPRRPDSRNIQRPRLLQPPRRTAGRHATAIIFRRRGVKRFPVFPSPRLPPSARKGRVLAACSPRPTLTGHAFRILTKGGSLPRPFRDQHELKRHSTRYRTTKENMRTGPCS